MSRTTRRRSAAQPSAQHSAPVRPSLSSPEAQADSLREDRRELRRSPRRPADAFESSQLKSLAKLQRRLKMLRAYRKTALRERTGDVELALETLIFQAAASPTAPPDITSKLDGIEAALQQILAGDEHAIGLQLGDGDVHASAVKSLQAEKQALCGQLDEMALHEQQLIDQCRRLEGELEQTQRAADDKTDRFEGLQQQIAALRQERDEAWQLLSSREPGDSSCEGGAHDSPVEILRRQLLEERQTIVELRLQIEDLSATLQSSSADKKLPSMLTWDEQKALLLKRLEGEDCESIADPQQRLDLTQLVKQTDQQIANRDKEIAELRRLLAEQSTASASMAIGAAAIAELLDSDELIREERENLQRLQLELKERSRAAEVELSKERANLARLRTELEEKQHELQRQSSNGSEVIPVDIGGEGKKKSSRWLSRLGLAEEAAAE